jgi:Zn-dependent alcohol dehydrogenase
LPYCNNFSSVNYGNDAAYQHDGGKNLVGYFFGQSSFASFTNVSEKSVVNVSEWVKNEKDMAIFAALGCSFQSGSATVTKLAGAGPKDTVVVMGLGGVGQAAIMVRFSSSPNTPY